MLQRFAEQLFLGLLLIKIFNGLLKIIADAPQLQTHTSQRSALISSSERFKSEIHVSNCKFGIQVGTVSTEAASWDSLKWLVRLFFEVANNVFCYFSGPREIPCHYKSILSQCLRHTNRLRHNECRLVCEYKKMDSWGPRELRHGRQWYIDHTGWK